MRRIDVPRADAAPAATPCRAAATLLCASVLGCAHRPNAAAPPTADLRPAPEKVTAVDPEDAIRSDPVGYLRRVRDRCAALEQYTLTLVRQERRGLIPVLREPEHIAAWFRQRPFSVRFKWLDPDIKYGESTYVEGRYDDQVRFIPRFGLLGLPPAEVRVSVRTPVFWGETKRPVTDFGMLRTMDLTLETLAADGPECRVTYVGLISDPLDGRPLRVIRIEYPPARHAAPVQELRIDAQTDLPRATRVYLADGSLDGSYEYRDVNLSVRLDDDDFLLEAERPPSPASRPAAPLAGRPMSAAP